MKKYLNKTILLIFTLIGISFSCNLYSQISYLGKISQHEDGVYGLTGAMSICFSIDKKNIYVGSQYALAVFNYDESTGSTEFIEAYRSDDDGNAGLEGPSCIKISPDDKYVYVSSDWLNCISLYERDPNSGTLELQHIFYDTDAGFDGLRGAHEIGISNDGLYIYVAAWNDAKISTFRRDTVSGYLSYLQSIGRYDEGGLVWPQSLKVSRDSRFVYVASHIDDEVSVFEINPDTGELVYVEKIYAESGQYSFSALEISYDNKFLYLAGRTSLGVYTRNTQNGKLTMKDLFKYDDPGISGLNVIYSLSVSPDDKNIYAITAADTSFVTFSRNLSNDEFQFTDSKPFMNFYLSNDGHSNTGLICDNNYVFGASYWESGVHLTKRNQTDGSLTYVKFIYEGESAIVDGLYNPRSCCADEQQKMVYVTTSGHGISIFQRNDTTGKLIYKNVANSQNQHTGMLGYNDHTALSKDGNYLYTLCQWFEPSGMAIFKADHTTDNLILLDSIMSDTYGSTGFDEPVDLAFSPEGEHLYVVSSFNQSGIAQYSYNPQNGSLELENFYEIENIGDPFDNITISNNGFYVFIWNTNSGDITMLGRDEISGALTYLSTSSLNSIGEIYLYGLTDIALSMDQKNLYATYEDNGVLVNYSIDSINHKLDVIQVFDYETLAIAGLQRIQKIGVRNDGTFVYTSSYDNNSVGLFYRDQSNGILTFLKDYTEPENDFNGLDKINGICIPDNDRNLYLISSVEEAVASYSIDLYLGPDRGICENDSALLDAGKGYSTYLWSTNETTQRIYAKEEGYYHVKTIDEFGFVDYDTVYVTVYRPEVDLGPDIAGCFGNTVIINSGFNGENLWNTGATSQSITVGNSGTYSVVITDIHLCQNRDSVNVIFHPLPELNLGSDVSACFGDSVILNSGFNGENLWNTGSASQSITVDNPGTYSVAITDNHHCENRDSVNVIFHPLPEVNLGADTTIQITQTLVISVDSIPDYDYLWHNGSTNSYITINNDSLTNNSLEAWVEVTTNFGCKNSDTLLITLDTNNVYIEPVEIRIGPIPTTEFVNIKSNYIITNINCYDIYGKYLFSKQPNSKTNIIDANDLSSGIYVLKITLINGQTKTIRILKLKF
ncbi:MAG: beta-propeller fold lactonase family protein [Bacteroidales bacterium]|nr:beta-propeller fold lactonase family protein [Bacteroidales bacterium]